MSFVIGLSLGIGFMSWAFRKVLKSGMVASFIDGHVVFETEKQMIKRLTSPLMTSPFTDDNT